MSEVKTDEDVSLESLAGEHELSGVDFCVTKLTGSWRGDEDADRCSFVLDGKTYTATEDPDDGYRSHMGSLVVGGVEVGNRFPPQRVVCTYETAYGGYSSDLLVIRDAATGKEVLVVGTQNNDDYYPWYMAEWSPQNMALNAEVKP